MTHTPHASNNDFPTQYRATRDARALFASEGARLVRLVDVGIDEADKTLLLRLSDGKRDLIAEVPLTALNVRVAADAKRLVDIIPHTMPETAPMAVLCGLDPETGVRYVRRAQMPEKWLALWDDGTGDELIVCPHTDGHPAVAVTPPHVPHD